MANGATFATAPEVFTQKVLLFQDGPSFLFSFQGEFWGIFHAAAAAAVDPILRSSP